jgi:DNA repair protein RadC
MGATRFILAHNHPSGDPTPSKEDLRLTRQLQETGKLLELECLDHLIVGDGTGAVVSLKENGRL